jgi:hypothetical protein
MNNGAYAFFKEYYDLDGIGAKKEFLIKTDNDGLRVHGRFSIAAQEIFITKLYEGAVITAVGTEKELINCDRETESSAKTKIYDGPTIDGGQYGKQLWSGKVGAGKFEIGASPHFNYEIILAQNTNYIFSVEKVNAGIHYVDIDFYGYEERFIDQEG